MTVFDQPLMVMRRPGFDRERPATPNPSRGAMAQAGDGPIGWIARSSPGLSGSDARGKLERHAARPLQPIGDDRDASLVNRFFTLLGRRSIMPQAMVGIRLPAETSGGARIPRISWTTLKLSGRGYANVNRTRLGQAGQ
jgi:hypothetical protein